MTVGGTYLRIGQPLSGRVALVQDDDVHTTATGQTLFAPRVQKAFYRAGDTL